MLFNTDLFIYLENVYSGHSMPMDQWKGKIAPWVINSKNIL
jgi:hypothetical protein